MHTTKNRKTEQTGPQDASNGRTPRGAAMSVEGVSCVSWRTISHPLDQGQEAAERREAVIYRGRLVSVITDHGYKNRTEGPAESGRKHSETEL